MTRPASGLPPDFNRKWVSLAHLSLTASPHCGRRSLMSLIEATTALPYRINCRDLKGYWSDFYLRCWIGFAVEVGRLRLTDAGRGQRVWAICGRHATRWPYDAVSQALISARVGCPSGRPATIGRPSLARSPIYSWSSRLHSLNCQRRALSQES